jgi:ParB-like chromosome segregation protein Spo0J
MTELAHNVTGAKLARDAGDQSPSDDGGYDSIYLIDSLPVTDVPLSSLQQGFFLRGAGTDPAHVKLLADAATSSELPPILVQKSNSRIIDGMHRIEAAKLRGEKSISARLVNCTDEDAFILAVKSNTLHGLPLSRTDRIFGAKRILSWHPDWSDRAVGVASGLSAKTVANLRRRSQDGAQHVGKRLGRDGKRRPLAGADGRLRAAEYILARPDASLREIAREADVSLGTVQDVRARMRRGADPTTAGQQRSSAEPLGAPEDGAAAASAPADHPGLRAGRSSAHQPTWTTISAKLANDPSLKYSEGGRSFIRWMGLRAMQAREWREFIDAIPAHWRNDVRLIADSMQEEWHEFSDQLRRRETPAT